MPGGSKMHKQLSERRLWAISVASGTQVGSSVLWVGRGGWRVQARIAPLGRHWVELGWYFRQVSIFEENQHQKSESQERGSNKLKSVIDFWCQK